MRIVSRGPGSVGAVGSTSAAANVISSMFGPLFPPAGMSRRIVFAPAFSVSATSTSVQEDQPLAPPTPGVGAKGTVPCAAPSTEIVIGRSAAAPFA